MYFLIDVQPIRLSPDELPALAFGSHYSVFKERPRDTPLHAGDVRVQCSDVRGLRRETPHFLVPTTQTAEVLATFRMLAALKQQDPEAITNYVVSGATCAEDALRVLKLGGAVGIFR